jgi:hypothetical protein
MKRDILTILVVFSLISLSSCSSVISGQHINVSYAKSAENDHYLVFGDVIYNKDEKKFYEAKFSNGYDYSIDSSIYSIDLYDDYFEITNYFSKQILIDDFDYQGKQIDAKTIIEENYSLYYGRDFTSSYNYVSWDEKVLSDHDQLIWDYAKNQSLKDNFPYLIEGQLKEDDENIYFNVNVYDKVMWKGSSLVNQGIVSSTFNVLNKGNHQISEIKSFAYCSIKEFSSNHLFYFNKKSNYLSSFNLTTQEEQKLFKRKSNYWKYYVNDEYALGINEKNIKTTFQLIKVNK